MKGKTAVAGKVLIPNHITIREYSTRKNVSRSSIYLAIKANRIVADKVGLAEVLMIDWEKYKDVAFVNYNKSEKSDAT